MIFTIQDGKKIKRLGIMGGNSLPPETPRHYSAVMFEELQGWPQLGPHDYREAFFSRRAAHLIAVVFPAGSGAISCLIWPRSKFSRTNLSKLLDFFLCLECFHLARLQMLIWIQSDLLVQMFTGLGANISKWLESLKKYISLTSFFVKLIF